MFARESISSSTLENSVRNEYKSKKLVSQKNCRLCKGRWLSMVEFLFCKEELPLSTTEPSHARSVADGYKHRLIGYYKKLIPAIAFAKHNKRPHDAHQMRFDFETIFTKAIKEEAWARLNGQHRSEVSESKIYSLHQLKRMTDTDEALWTTTASWLKAVDTAGYALYLFYKTHVRMENVCFKDNLIAEVRQAAKNHEKEAQKYEDTLIEGLRLEIEPQAKRKEQKEKKVRARRITEVNTLPRVGFLCCFSDVNISAEEAEIIKRNLNL